MVTRAARKLAQGLLVHVPELITVFPYALPFPPCFHPCPLGFIFLALQHASTTMPAPPQNVIPIVATYLHPRGRPTAMVTRAVYNWGMWLANIARRGEKPWDQTTFAPAMEWVSSEVTVRHLTMVGGGWRSMGGRACGLGGARGGNRKVGGARRARREAWWAKRIGVRGPGDVRLNVAMLSKSIAGRARYLHGHCGASSPQRCTHRWLRRAPSRAESSSRCAHMCMEGGGRTVQQECLVCCAMCVWGTEQLLGEGYRGSRATMSPRDVTLKHPIEV